MQPSADSSAPAPPAFGVASAPRARWPVVALVLGLAVAGLAALSIPPDRTIGANTRLVFFHGAVVWNAILLALAGGVVGVIYLVRSTTRRAQDLLAPAPGGNGGAWGPYLWRVLSFATLFWALSFFLSFPVMIMTWGGVLWRETRLVMTMEIVVLFAFLWTFGLLAPWRRVLAALMALAAVAMVTLILTTPGTFHPDNPVFNSGNPRFWGGFLAILLGLVTANVGAIFSFRTRT